METDQQKDTVNADILKVSEKLLDFSRNDVYRSFANLNLAIYYSEQVNPKRGNEEDMENARKSKMHAELVFYKDMPHALYLIIGAATTQKHGNKLEETLTNMVGAAKSACKNLLHFTKHFPTEAKQRSETYADVSALLNEIEIKLSSG